MTVNVTARLTTGEKRATSVGLLDCDVHNAMPSRETLKPYLPENLHVYYDRVKAPAFVQVGARPVGTWRLDTFPAGGGPPGSDLDLLREQYLDPFDVRAAVLSALDNTLYGWPTQGELALAICRGLNDYVAEHWLEKDARLYGAICVPLEDGARAAMEIERVAANPRFVKVLLLVRTREPLGDPKYWPIYEAAAAHSLPIGVHIGGFSGTESATGWPVYGIERRVGFIMPYCVQTVSLVYSRVFEQFPGLQFVLEEGGIGWMPSLMWRLDRAWEAMRDEHPHLQEPPSSVIRKHFWLTTQPLDEPEKPEYLAQLFDQLDMDNRILFASDYPHHDFDDPTRVLSASVIGRERREQILASNALDVMRFPAGF
jgi:predicted TIM-barrel fold metal-dependent hydrolase